MMMMRGTVSSSSISSWTSVLFVVVVVLSSSSSSSSSSEENSFSLFSCPFLCVVFLPKNSLLPFSSLNNNRVCLDSKTQKSQKILNPPPVASLPVPSSKQQNKRHNNETNLPFETPFVSAVVISFRLLLLSLSLFLGISRQTDFWGDRPPIIE